MRHNFFEHWWSWLTGAQHILSTTVAEYRRPRTVLEIFGQQYRVTHAHGVDVWGRSLWWRRDDAIVVESPIKRQFHSTSAKRSS